jgi:hypothetical protein
MLIISGGFKILNAIWAFKYNNDLSDRVQTVFFERDLASWGWLWLAVGVVLIAARFEFVASAQWARWVGIVSAGITTILYLPWIYYQPLSGILSTALAVLVIYALVAYGGPREHEGIHRFTVPASAVEESVTPLARQVPE